MHKSWQWGTRYLTVSLYPACLNMSFNMGRDSYYKTFYLHLDLFGATIDTGNSSAEF